LNPRSTSATHDSGSTIRSENKIDSRSRLGKQQIATKEDKCNKCGERGHWAPQCDVVHMTRKMEKLESRIHDLSKKKKSKFQVNSIAALSTDFDDTSDSEIEGVADFAEAYVVDTTLLRQPSTTDITWYLDNGAIRHAMGNKAFLSNLAAPTLLKTVRSTGGQTHDVKGVGIVKIKLPTGQRQEIHHVLYVPTIQKNLLSVGALTDSHYLVEFQNKLYLIREKSIRTFMVRATRNTGHGLYILDASYIIP
jgi:hypothetical protein